MTNKGDTHERDIEEQGRKRGCATLRAPGSGGGGDADRPDVILCKGEQFGYTKLYAFEAKKDPDGTEHFTAGEIIALLRWSYKAGADPYVTVRPDRRRTGQVDRYLHVQELHRTDSGNYSLRKQDFDRCLSLDEVLR